MNGVIGMPIQHEKEIFLKNFLEGHGDVYNRKEVNYTGIVKNGTEYYKDLLAELILEKYKTLSEKDFIKFLIPENFPVMENEKDFTPIHDFKEIEINNDSGRNEENIAKSIFKNGFNGQSLLKVSDYQVPVNWVDKGNVHGKIDIILVDENNKIILSELKDEKSQETLLRAVLELKTYMLKIAMNDSALNRIQKTYSKFDDTLVLPEIIPAIILCKDKEDIQQVNSRGQINVLNQPLFDFKEMKKEDALYQLCKAWNIEFFELTIDKKGETDGQRDYYKDEYTLKHLTY